MKCRARLGAAVDPDGGAGGGGGTCSGLLWARRHRRVRAQITRMRGRAQVMELGARWRAGHGSGGARALH